MDAIAVRPEPLEGRYEGKWDRDKDKNLLSGCVVAASVYDWAVGMWNSRISGNFGGKQSDVAVF